MGISVTLSTQKGRLSFGVQVNKKALCLVLGYVRGKWQLNITRYSPRPLSCVNSWSLKSSYPVSIVGDLLSEKI